MCFVRALVDAAWYCGVGLDRCKIVVEVRAVDAVLDRVAEYSSVGQGFAGCGDHCGENVSGLCWVYV